MVITFSETRTILKIRNAFGSFDFANSVGKGFCSGAIILSIACGGLLGIIFSTSSIVLDSIPP